jgi:hypothetical protein
MSRYQSNPNKGHWKIVKNIFKYLRRTKNVFPIYERDELVVHGYLYASFQSNIDDNRFQSKICFYSKLCCYELKNFQIRDHDILYNWNWVHIYVWGG